MAKGTLEQHKKAGQDDRGATQAGASPVEWHPPIRSDRLGYILALVPLCVFANNYEFRWIVVSLLSFHGVSSPYII